MEVVAGHPGQALEMLVREDDARLVDLAVRSGFTLTDELSGTAWMDADQRAPIAPVDGFTVVDRAARAVITEAGYGEYFIHRTGHGIGVTTHEPPYMIEGEELPLVPGMCFSVEPGIYLPGRFGVRIEDIVTVTEDGGRRLNTTSRELVIVD